MYNLFIGGYIMKEASERVAQMKSNFMKLHSEGKSIKEIADAYALTSRTVYFHRQDVPQKAHVLKNGIVRTLYETVDIDEIRDLFSTTIDDIDTILSRLNKILDEE